MIMRLPAITMCLALSAVMAACEDRAAVTTTAQAPPAAAAAAPPASAPSPRSIAAVREIVAEQFSLKIDDVDANKPLSAYKADELDVVEIIMECEDRFQVSLSDEALEKLAGSKDPAQVTRLTPAHFAYAVENAPREEPRQRQKQPTPASP